MKRRTQPNWSSLPEDVLAIIAKRLFLHSLDDLLRFRSVCYSFRSSSSIFYPPKTVIPTSSFRIYFSIDSTPGNGSNFMLTKSTIYVIQPLHKISNTHQTPSTWLVRIEESSPGKVRISDPVGGCRFKTLSGELPKSLNLLDYRIKEITTAYRLELATLGKRSRVYRNEMYRTVPNFFWKVSVSECGDGFTVMAITYDAVNPGKLVVWRNADEKWTNIDTTIGRFRDIVSHNEKFYALAYTGLTIAVDCKSFSITEVANPLQNRDFQSMCLVKSCMDLFLIAHSGHCLKVYKLDEEKREWLIPVMDELEDRVWFVGKDCAFSLSVKELSGLEGNCVYIIYDLGMRYEKCHPGLCTMIYDLENDDVQFVGPLLCNIFWPPPTWVKQHSSSTSSRSHRCRPCR